MLKSKKAEGVFLTDNVQLKVISVEAGDKTEAAHGFSFSAGQLSSRPSRHLHREHLQQTYRSQENKLSLPGGCEGA